MKRTHGQLADGREIIFFDSGDDTVRAIHDTRELPATGTSSELRFDPLLEDWVTIASHRQVRTHLPTAGDCPLCPSTPGRATEIPAPDYEVVVFENRFPSLAGVVDPRNGYDGLTPRRAGIGRCEVVCFTSDHRMSVSQLSPKRVSLILEVLADRTVELSRLPGVEQVYCFENCGEEIGVTLQHPHGQIYAYPFVPPRTQQMLSAARRHHHKTGRNLFADVLAAELADPVRLVGESRHWVAFVPSAARWPVELHLYPKRRVPDLPALHAQEAADFADLYLDVLHRMDRLYEQPLPYIAAWHQAPVCVDRDLAYLHLEMFSIRRTASKLKYLAGSESGMGAFINDVVPEEIAGRLRDAAVR
jgi:UDPglucose--hexose-1-phosphate uridylyltransferase